MFKICTRVFVALVFSFLVSACSKPQVYLFARYLEPTQVKAIESKLEVNGLEVTSNKQRFPSKVKTSTLVHSVTQDQNQIDLIAQLLSQEGFENIKTEIYAASGKQFFTRGSFGLYLYPNGKFEASLHHKRVSGEQVKLVDLPKDIETVFSCSSRINLFLQNEGVARVDRSIWNDANQDYESVSTSGKWKYRPGELLVELPEYSEQQLFKVAYHEVTDGRYIRQITTFIPQNENAHEYLSCTFKAELLEYSGSP